MTPSKKEPIINLVNWIHKNREKSRLLYMQKKEIESKITERSSETITVIDSLKKEMGKETTINIKIDDKYYTLTQHQSGVEIEDLIIHVEG